MTDRCQMCTIWCVFPVIRCTFKSVTWSETKEGYILFQSEALLLFPSFLLWQIPYLFLYFFSNIRKSSVRPLSFPKQGTNNIFPMILFGTSHLISEARSVSFLPQRSRSYFDRPVTYRGWKVFSSSLVTCPESKRYSIKYSTREVSSRFAFWESIPTGLFRKITFSSSYNTFSFTLLLAVFFCTGRKTSSEVFENFLIVSTWKKQLHIIAES